MKELHAWDLDPAAAADVQTRLREQLDLRWDGREVRTVGGVDMSLAGDRAHAAIVVLRLPDLQPLYGVTADAPLVFPYVPGLLSFREGPAVLAAWGQLKDKPDVVMFDGQGIAHPRGMGIAAHLGLWLQVPTIGVAKSHLYGRYHQPGPERGDSSDLVDERDRIKLIGAVLTTRAGVKPVFVSPGHLIDVPHAVDLVRRCLGRYRLPEPTGWAHKLAAGQPLPPPPLV